MNSFYIVLSPLRQFMLLAMIVFAANSYAHRGPADEVDNCRIRVGSEKIHVSLYTPEAGESNGFCQYVPHVGKTIIVFDYEGHKLRNTTVEFEITKEPEGVRIFHQEPEKIKTGTLNTTVDFSQYGAGEYLIHITLVSDGEKQDNHLPIFIGQEEGKSYTGALKLIIPAVFIAIMLFFMFRQSKTGEEK